MVNINNTNYSIPQLIEWLLGQKYTTVDENSETMTEEFEREHKWELSRNCFIDKVIRHLKEYPSDIGIICPVCKTSEFIEGTDLNTYAAGLQGFIRDENYKCEKCGGSIHIHIEGCQDDIKLMKTIYTKCNTIR